MSSKEDIQLKEFYVIVSEKTGRYKLNDIDHVTLFTSRDVAEEYAKKQSFARVEGPKHIDFDVVCEISRQAGAIKVDIYDDGKKKEADIPVIRRKNLNPKLNGALAHLKETGKKDYLYKFMECKFLIPCRIKNGTDIMYGMAQVKDETYTLAFSDLEEFWNWNGEKEWKPLEVTYEQLLRMSNRRDIILNLTGNRYILTKSKIDKINDFIKLSSQDDV